VEDVFVGDGHLFFDGDEGVEAFVVARAVEVEPHGFAVAREGVAVGAGGHVAHDDAALRFGDVADLPLDEGDGEGGQGCDGAFFFRRGQQERDVAIEDGRADGVFGGGDLNFGG